MSSRISLQCSHGLVDVNIPSQLALAVIFADLCDMCPSSANHLTDRLWTTTGAPLDMERTAGELGVLDGEILLLDRPRATRMIAAPQRQPTRPRSLRERLGRR